MAWLGRGRPTADRQFFVKPAPLRADDSKLGPTAGAREIGADNAERLRAEAHERVELALADHTSKQVGRTIIPQLAAIVLIVSLFEPRLDSSAIWWWALAATVNVARGAFFNRAHKQGVAQGRAHSLPGFLNTVFSLFFGAIWGSLVIIAEPGGVETRALAVVIVLAVMSLGAVVSAGSRSMYLTEVLGNALTIVIGWAVFGRLSWTFVALIIVYFGVAAFLHDTVHRLIRNNIESGYRNEVLAARLASALAYEDPMTGLRNREGLSVWFDEVGAGRPGRIAVVAVGNVERLSAINELFGPELGDEVLVTIGQRLSESATPAMASCRLAGDEFAIVEIVATNDSAAIIRAEQRLDQQLLAAVRDAIEMDGQFVDVSMSTAVEAGPSSTFDQLLIGASAAVRLERSRRSPSLSAAQGPLGERRELINDLKVGLEDGSLAACFQPVVDCELREVIAWEALARWVHPTRGNMQPDQFLGLIELGGLADEFSGRIVDQSIRFAAGLIEAGRDHAAFVHVNLTASQARRTDIVPVIEASLAEHAVLAKYLTVEITEQEVPDIGGGLIENLRRLEAAGVGIAIDDFGTGYSSLSHLYDIRPTELKIDKLFVDGLPDDPTSAALVRGILGLAQGMGLFTVAEGVENEAQADFLRRHGCDSFQGFLTSPALTPAEAKQFLNGFPVADRRTSVIPSPRF